MARDWDEEEVSLIGIVGAEDTIANVLEEIAFAGVFSGELSRGLVKGVGIAVWVYIDLKFLFHLRVIQSKYVGRMVNIGEIIFVILVVK